MLETVWAVVHDGKIETVGVVDAPEGTRALVTLLVEDENDFWQAASSESLNEIWDNEEDDVYAELLKPEVILVRYPFSDLTSSKVRPAVVVNASHSSQDLFVVALTSKTSNLLAGEFILADWKLAGLNVETAVKRGIFTIKQTLVKKYVGKLSDADAEQLENSLRTWLDLP